MIAIHEGGVDRRKRSHFPTSAPVDGEGQCSTADGLSPARCVIRPSPSRWSLMGGTETPDTPGQARPRPARPLQCSGGGPQKLIGASVSREADLLRDFFTRSQRLYVQSNEITEPTLCTLYSSVREAAPSKEKTTSQSQR